MILEIIILLVVYGMDGKVLERLCRVSWEVIEVVLVIFNGKMNEDVSCGDYEKLIDLEEIECLMYYIL